MNCKIEKKNGVVVISVQVKRATVEISGEFKQAVLHEIEENNTRIVIDMSQTEFVDSSFLGALVAGLKSATIKNGDLKIIGLQPPVRAMFELTRLYRIFDIFDNLEDAVNNFG